MSYLWRILTAMRMTIKEFFSFKTNKFFWVNIIAMIVVVVVMIYILIMVKLLPFPM